MSDTTTVTSDEKLCATCRAPFGEDDDKRCNDCSDCRGDAKVETPVAQDEEEDSLPDGVKALNIPIKRGVVAKGPSKKFYWLGVSDDCPWHSVTSGGVSFARYTGQIDEGSQDGRQEFRDNVFMGSPIHHLTDVHVKRILEEVSLKVVRHFRIEERAIWNGKTVSICTGSLISMKTAKQGGNSKHGYAPHESDLPLGEFLWMVEVRNKNDRPFPRNSPPPTLVTRP